MNSFMRKSKKQMMKLNRKLRKSKKKRTYITMNGKTSEIDLKDRKRIIQMSSMSKTTMSLQTGS